MKGHLNSPVTRTCAQCGREFLALSWNAVCCSDECQKAHRKALRAVSFGKWRRRPEAQAAALRHQREYRARMYAAQKMVPRLLRTVREMMWMVERAYQLGAPSDVMDILLEIRNTARKALGAQAGGGRW